MSTTSNLNCRDLVAGYGGEPILKGVTLRLVPGEILGVTGPNGAGKSTLIKALGGVLPAISGEVQVNGASIASLSGRERARRIAVVTQGARLEFPFTVCEFVSQGRYPHLGPFQRMGQADEARVAAVLAETGLTALAERRIDGLSGGECQRAWLARGLCQAAGTLLLDEPAAYLDVRYQAVLCGVLRRLAQEGRAVLCVLHDLNLAARLCDRLILLNEGRVVADAAPREVLTQAVLGPVYGGEPQVSVIEDGYPVVLFPPRMP